MSDELPVVEGHPRADELQEIWRALGLRRPDSIEDMGPIDIVDHQFPLPLCFFDEAHVPACFLDDRPTDEVAFGLAYSTCLDPMQRLLDDATNDSMIDLLGSPLGLPLAPVLGIAGGITAVWRGVTRFAERERAAIEEAVDWTHRAHFDPNAGVKMFMSLSGWLEQNPLDKPAEEVSALKQLGFTALFAPIAGAMAVPLKKDPPMLTAVDRAAAVRTAVVARGLHR